jgi:hypothetical protein
MRCGAKLLRSGAPLVQGRGVAEKRTAMAAGIVCLIGVMLLATQLMGQASTGAWPSVTLASELDIPADRVFSGWIIVDRPIQFILGDVQLWIVLVFASALIYWVTDWTSEKLNRLGKRAPAPEPARQNSELADGGNSF